MIFTPTLDHLPELAYSAGMTIENHPVPVLTDLDQALALLDDVVRRQGADFVYYRPDSTTISCANIPLGSEYRIPENHPARITGCLIGEAMRLYLRERFDDIDWKNDANVFAELPGPFRSYLGDNVLKMYMIAQKVQDDGHTWGAAYSAASAFRATMYWRRRTA